MSVLKIEENEFDEKVNNSEKRVLVDFYAEWCGPCKMLGPVIEEISEEVDNCEFYKVNIDEAGELAERYGIMSIPTLLIFEKGELVNQVVGFRTKDELKEILASE